jgi:PAS domain S-box-containing protein
VSDSPRPPRQPGFVPPPRPADERERLAALRRYRVVDTPPERAFDDIAQLAALICEAPVAAVSFIEDERQWFKARVGIPVCETSRDEGFCAWTILHDDVFVVPDAVEDPRFQEHPNVCGGPQIRFYAGAPLVTASGQRLGALSVNDFVARQLSSGQLEALRALSRQVVDQLELRVALEQTLESEARYGALVENFPCVTYALAPATESSAPQLVYVSPQVHDLVGVPATELVRRLGAWRGLLHPDDREIILPAYAVLAEDTSGASREYRLVRPDGTEVWVQDICSIVRGSDGEARYVQGFLLDVGERKAAEATRERLELELRLAQKLEAVGQLAAGIAHEINTPIQFVGDSAHFLQESFETLAQLLQAYRDEAGAHAAEPRERLERAEEDADLDYLLERAPTAFARTFEGVGRVATIVRAMKEFAHPSTVEKTATDLNAAVENTLVVAANELRYVADVETDLGELPPVVCHADDVNQVLLNLVVNAAHAVGDVVGDSGERGRIRVSTRRDGEDAVIEVSDTGAGIAPEHVERIFDPFFTTKPVGKGTGQGLAITRRIVVERHGGSVSVESDLGLGAMFTIRLPMNASPSHRYAA